MQTNLSPLSTEDWQDIAEYLSSRPATPAVTKVTPDQRAQEADPAISKHRDYSPASTRSGVAAVINPRALVAPYDARPAGKRADLPPFNGGQRRVDGNHFQPEN
jgi:hypothetical protein